MFRVWIDKREKPTWSGEVIFRHRIAPAAPFWLLPWVLVATTLSGCHSTDPLAEPFGKTFYLDGAGNWGFGRMDVREGLQRAGYQGDCEIFTWTYTLNPLLDQLNVIGAKAAASKLADRIRVYTRKYPDQDVNIIALSGGTGVAVWALEQLRGKYKVNNVFFLGSSLSSKYDLRKALTSVEGKLYIYYSNYDLVLKVVPWLGTIDRKYGAKPAGQVGFQGPGLEKGRIINIGWEDKWRRLGWDGGHTEGVQRPFVQYEIAPKLMNKDEEHSPPTDEDEPAQVEDIHAAPREVE